MVVLVQPTTDTVICRCLGISESQIVQAVDEAQVGSLREAIHCTGAGTGCTACHRRIRHLIEARRGQSSIGYTSAQLPCPAI